MLMEEHKRAKAAVMAAVAVSVAVGVVKVCVAQVWRGCGFVSQMGRITPNAVIDRTSDRSSPRQ
jgi:hypothetical protein